LSQKVELPHGAYILPDDELVCLSLENVTLNFSISDWFSFAEKIEEITTVLQMSTVENVIQCPACNTISSYVQYEEPDEHEIN
tara:strand:+ start:2166 stop:2414 length:249 start_codon:yes stop_codon:yes gene_type:complete